MGDYILAAFGEVNDHGLTERGVGQIQRLSDEVFGPTASFDCLDHLVCSTEIGARQSAEIFLKKTRRFGNYSQVKISEVPYLVVNPALESLSLMQTMMAFQEIRPSSGDNILLVSSPAAVRDLAFWTLKAHDFLDGRRHISGIDNNGFIVNGEPVNIPFGSAVALNYSTNEWRVIPPIPEPAIAVPSPQVVRLDPPKPSESERKLDLTWPFKSMEKDYRVPLMYFVHNNPDAEKRDPFVVAMRASAASDFFDKLNSGAIAEFGGGAYSLEGGKPCVRNVNGRVGDGKLKLRVFYAPHSRSEYREYNGEATTSMFVGSWEDKNSAPSGITTFRAFVDPVKAGYEIIK